MQNITGNPVDGDDFFGREEELKQLRGAVAAGNHVLLVGPRRVGKSSLVAELARQLSKDGWTTITVDVQHTADEAAFLHEIHEAIRRTGVKLPLHAKATDAIQRFLKASRVTKVTLAKTTVELSDSPEDWESAATSLKSLISALPENNRQVLIAIDELPIFLTKLLGSDGGPTRVRAILDWLRSVRQASGSKLPWILCGSIGLDSFVAKHRLEGSINELLPLPIDAIDAPQAIALLKRLGERPEHGCPISDEAAALMIAKVGWLVPYYLQLLFHGLKSLPIANRSATFPSELDIDAAYHSLLSPHHRVHFGHWDSRLGDLLDDNEEANARRLLNHLSSHASGRTRKQLYAVLAKAHPQADPVKLERELRDLLEFLERDGYLGRLADRFAFRSFLLRDYWCRRFGE
jgi:uncharacterized protein